MRMRTSARWRGGGIDIISSCSSCITTIRSSIGTRAALGLFVLHLEPLVPDPKPVQLLDRHGRRPGIVIAHKPEPPAPPGILLHHDAHGEQLPIRRKQAVHVQIGELIGHVEDEQVGALRTLVGARCLDGRAWIVAAALL